ncbi:hypothetical protein [Schumannella soli]|uniref:YfhO family protein n=1 Tax=Schumannella soli TaxID=2590779 RepID=A0A506XTF4_9MICO|nr:hypothetical protein [Schumannella soli]TPW75991.1 hypothetical protein FJ657_09165 [Schumannella soli]
MTATASVPEVRAPAPSARERLRSGATAILPPLLAVVATVVGALLPLLRNPRHYYWDDTVGAAVGVWQRVPDALLHGRIPFLELDMWRGGNLIAEAATGMWNPVIVAIMFITRPFDDMAVAITVAKIIMFAICALGVYALAGSYGARRWAAAAVAPVLPLSGWALFMDGAAWINGTAIMAFAPWAWWALRRAFIRGGRARDILIAAIAGYLVCATGNPYGMLVLAVAFLGIGIEALVTRQFRALRWIIPLGAAIVLLNVIVYLPFLLTSSVGIRANQGTFNDEEMTPSLSNLLGMSVPVYKPYIRQFGLPYMSYPGVYLAWFALPLLPWFDWRSLRAHWRKLVSVGVVGVVFLLMVLGPTQIGMFRWPARLLPFLFLALVVVLAVLISAGIVTTKWRLRAALTAIIVGFGAWMAFSDGPPSWKWIGVTSVATLALIWIITRWSRSSARVSVVLLLGTVLFTGSQAAVTPFNGNVSDFHVPASRSALTEHFEAITRGRTIQVVDWYHDARDLKPDELWTGVMLGNMYAATGIESLTAYSGIGFNAADKALCENYNGGSCKKLWTKLWTPAGDDGTLLVDLIGADTVIVQKGYVAHPTAPSGWSKTSENPWVIVYQRDAADDDPAGRITHASGDAEVRDDESASAYSETATVSTSEESTVTFARLAWPGYSATLDGRALPVETGPAGLLQVTIPADTDSGRLQVSFAPPGSTAGIAAGAAGLLIIVVLMVLARRRTREAASID